MNAPRPPVATGPAPAGEGLSKPMVFLGVLAVLAVSAAAGLLAWELTSPASPESAAAGEPSGSAAAPSPSAGASSSAGAVAAPGASGGPGGDPTACFASVLPANAFGEKAPDLSACCRERPAYRTMLELKSAIVSAGGGGVTPAMLEWSKLGWYETAAFALLRAHCCPGAPPLTTIPDVATCKFDAALADVASAVDDEQKMERALRDYRAAVDCVVEEGYGEAFGRGGPPYGFEVSYLEELLRRVRKARR